jgi:hypothetical protein
MRAVTRISAAAATVRSFVDNVSGHMELSKTTFTDKTTLKMLDSEAGP